MFRMKITELRRTALALTLLLLVCVHQSSGGNNKKKKPKDKENVPNVARYLMKYGYVAQGPDGAPSNPSDIPRALKTLQMFAGIPQTGRLDEATVELLGKSRCGVEDIIGSAKMQASLRPGSEPGFNRFTAPGDRERRYNIDGSKWPRNDLLFHYENFAEDVTEAEMKDALNRAWKVWSDVTPLTFTEIGSKEEADIVIKFSRGNHGDGAYAAFDGPGGTLAHAYFPENGDAHFDEDEDFTVRSAEGVNLFIVAAHEFGHSLGLAHSSEQGALMYPWYQGYVPDFVLPRDDILGIQQLYGKPEISRPDTPVNDGDGPYIKPGRPDACTSNWNAVTIGGDGRTYAFKGRYLWAINDAGVVHGFPKKIGLMYRGAPTNIHAAVTMLEGGQAITYMFKGSKMWRFTDFILEPGYPKKTSPRGIPQSPNAAFVWGGNGKTYIFKGSRYYEFDMTREKIVGGPQKIKRKWPGLPDKVDGALQWRNGKSYFFKGDSYWRFNDAKLKVNKEYPRSKALYWMGCGLEEGQVLPERLEVSTEV